MRSRLIVRLASIAGALLVLSACGGFRDQLGLTKQSPDEFRVVARAPLTLPPDYNLRPPRPGEPRPQEGSAREQARQAVFRGTSSPANPLGKPISADGLSLGERSFLRAAGADKIDPNIRAAIDRETFEINAESDSFVEALIFWRDKPAPGVVVDAAQEAKRLRENMALGKAPTEGETPTIKRKQQGLF